MIKSMRALEILLAAGLSVLVFSPERAQAHSLLTTPFPPRSQNSGITTGPCGTDPHTTPVAAQAGSTVTIHWEETIHHTGHFEFGFHQEMMPACR